MLRLSEMVRQDTVSEFPVREHQINHDVDGWRAYEEQTRLLKTLSFKRSGGNPADRVPTRFRRGGGQDVSTSVSLKCQCLIFAKRRELTNRDQLLDVLVAWTGAESVDDGEAWSSEFALGHQSLQSTVPQQLLKLDTAGAKSVVEARPLGIAKHRATTAAGSCRFNSREVC